MSNPVNPGLRVWWSAEGGQSFLRVDGEWHPMGEGCEKLSAMLAEPSGLRAALVKIASGMGVDLLGTTSLSREDLQAIARAALAGKEKRDE